LIIFRLFNFFRFRFFRDLFKGLYFFGFEFNVSMPISFAILSSSGGNPDNVHFTSRADEANCYALKTISSESGYVYRTNGQKAVFGP